MSARRNEVAAAFASPDQDTIRELGWWEIWEACATWWKPRQTATPTDMVPYAQLLGDEDPAQVLQALRELAGEWRPSPGAIRGHLHPANNDTAHPALARDPAATSNALTATARALNAGEQPCGCNRHNSTWPIDQHGVLRCTTCNGLEQGQSYAAEDAGLIGNPS
jgi:hypothetical protein